MQTLFQQQQKRQDMEMQLKEEVEKLEGNVEGVGKKMHEELQEANSGLRRQENA